MLHDRVLQWTTGVSSTTVRQGSDLNPEKASIRDRWRRQVNYQFIDVHCRHSALCRFFTILQTMVARSKEKKIGERKSRSPRPSKRNGYRTRRGRLYRIVFDSSKSGKRRKEVRCKEDLDDGCRSLRRIQNCSAAGTPQYCQSFRIQCCG